MAPWTRRHAAECGEVWFILKALAPRSPWHLLQIHLIWQIFGGKRIQSLMTTKIFPAFFSAGRESMFVVQAVQAANPMLSVIFTSVGRLLFSIKVRDRLLTEPWLRLQSPWDDCTDAPPPVFFSATHLRTNIRTPAPIHWHSHRQVPSKPLSAEQSLFPHQIHKVYLSWASTQKEHFPAVSLQRGKIVANNPGLNFSPSQVVLSQYH